MSILCLACASAFAADPGWVAYGHDAGGTRYSPLKQINRTNVVKLRPAWTYHTGALEQTGDANRKSAFEATPILIDGVLYLTTPFNAVIALDPATGREKWKYDPKLDHAQDYSEVTSRGVSAWKGAKGELLLVEGTLDGRLLAIYASSGKLAWETDLKQDVSLRDPGNYQVTSAPAVVGDLVITGSSIGDNRAVDVERGIVRAFEVRTGKLRWTWDPIPWATRQTTRTGAANAWGALAADPARDLVFVPTGSASPDYFGGLRPGDNRHANSVAALKASTGELIWSYQVVHHDLWDYDVAGQPALIEFAGKPAVAVTTKMGLLFVLDRLTGKPLHTVEERAVPKSDIARRGFRAHAAHPHLVGNGAAAPHGSRSRCGGPERRRSRCLPRAHLHPSQRGDLHAAQPARQPGISRQCRRSQLGQRRLGSRTRPVIQRYQPPARHRSNDSPRRIPRRCRAVQERDRQDRFGR